MRKVFIVLCLLLASSFAWCKSRNSWENLNTLEAGDKIQVAEKDHEKVTGAFVSENAQGITLYEKNGKETIDRGEVVRVRVGGQRLRHMLVGIGIGAGADAALAAVSYENCGNCTPSRGAVMGAAVFTGAAIGAIVGGLMSEYKTVYQAANP